MNIISWAMFVEGSTDREYLGVVLPRVIEDIAFHSERGSEAQVPEQPVNVFGLSRRDFQTAAELICKAKDAFVILFVHGDTGGRGQQTTLADRTSALCKRVNDLCSFDTDFCIPVTPMQETDAWCLADRVALRAAFGLREGHQFSQLTGDPRDVEKIRDPKEVAYSIANEVIGGRRRSRVRFPYAAVAQAQDLEVLRQLSQVQEMYGRVRHALSKVGYS